MPICPIDGTVLVPLPGPHFLTEGEAILRCPNHGGYYMENGMRLVPVPRSIATVPGANQERIINAYINENGDLTLIYESGTVVIDNVFSKSITIENPTNTEDITFFHTEVAITVQIMRAVVRGTNPSVTWTIRHSTDRNAAGSEVVTGGTITTSQTTGSDIIVFNDATIIADSWIWIETTASSGTINEIGITLYFTIDG